MLLLTSTSDKLQVITSAATAVHVQASYVDYSGGTVSPDRRNTIIAAATTTDVVLAPAASTQRNIKHLTVRAKGGAQTVTVQHTDGTTVVELISVALGAGQTLIFTDGLGFEVMSASGQILTQGSIGGTPAVLLGAAAAAGVAPTFLRTDDTIDAFDGVSPPNVAAAAVVGVNNFAARSDHTHTIGAGVVTRAMQEATGKGWQFLGTATGAAVTVGPVVWTGTFQQFLIHYLIKGYNGGTPVGRILVGAASISTTAATNGSSLSEGVTAPTSAPSIPGCPLAVTLSAIARQGVIHIDGASGSFKSYEILGQNGNPAVATPPTMFRAAGVFSDLGTNLPLQRAQLSVYDGPRCGRSLHPDLYGWHLPVCLGSQ
jgi:hypothetical protein